MSDQSAPMGPDSPAPEPVDAGPVGTEDGASTQPAADDYQQRLEKRLEEMAQGNQSLLQQFQDFQQSFNQPDVEEDDPYPLDEGEDGYDEQEAQRWLDERIEAKARELMTPMQEQQAQREITSGFDGLKQKYPELQDPAVSKAVIDDVTAFADEIGLDINNPRAVLRLIEQTYQASVAQKRASQETPAGTRREVQLESAAGAAPADREEDTQANVIAAAQRMIGI